MIWESSFGCWILSPNICFENFGIGMAFLHEKTMFGKEKNNLDVSNSMLGSELLSITAGWSGNWPASHYFIHLVKMLICFSISSGKVVIIFDLFVFLF